MAISDVRTYLKNRITDENSSFYEHTDGFNAENVPTNIKTRSFFIEYQNPSNLSTEGDLIHDQVTATVRLFFKGYRTVQQSIDSAMDTCHNIKLRASKISNYTATIKRCTCNSVTIEPGESNDNNMIVTMEFDIEMFFNTI